MKLFACGHVTHPWWRMAIARVVTQLREQMAQPGYVTEPSLGLLYITDRYAAHAQDILAHLREEFAQVSDWVGTSAVGICASGTEYWDKPALAVMLCDLPREQYRVFSGLSPLPDARAGGWPAATALVHAEPQTPELPELVAELAARTQSGFVFGGLNSARVSAPQFASHDATQQGCFFGGLSGLALAPGLACMTELTQGCLPIGAPLTLTRADDHVALTLSDEPALDVMLRRLDISLDDPAHAIAVLRHTLVGLSAPHQAVVGPTGHLHPHVRVRHIVGMDPMRQGLALAEPLQEGMGLVFCRRDAQAARADLMRICAQLRQSLEPEHLPLETAWAADSPPTHPPGTRRIAGAIYVSCTGRGGEHFGGPSAEMQIIRHALGDVPLVGFYAAGEIAGHQLYGYTGVLTVFPTE